ncbi:MAG: peptidoglycan-binding protein LysM [Desulfatiglans sp.]|jgi:nucleoid-associated protein YgaU|nr:peptidoglycan-binding protein LysM [Desulfatiglans sp.]
MGLIDFVKNAGAKVMGVETKAVLQEREKIAENALAKALERHVQKTGVAIENLKIEFDDEVATVYGTTKSQPDREKIALAVGNVNGVSKVDDRIQVDTSKAAPEQKPEPETKYYTVAKGDTLSKIAKEFYGNPMKYTVIFEANKPMLTNPDLIYPGQVLRIPIE